MTYTTKSTAASKWESIKPKLLYLVIGLIAGPLITNVAGWQVMSGTARDQANAQLVDQQAKYCAAKARTEVADTSKLDYNARTELAKKFALMPDGTAAKADVANACARMLAA